MATSIPQKQKGVIVNNPGGADVLEYREDLDVPVPKEGEVLVKNEFVGLNYIDTYFRSGQYPMKFPAILGSEAEGTIVSIGPNTSETYGLKVGDRVVSMSSASYAEYTVYPIAKAIAVPSNIEPGVAAAAYLQGLTALSLVHEAGAPINKGDFVLVHAAAGGMGLLLTQLLSDIGARVIGTASTNEKLEEAKKNGAEFVLNYVADKDTLVEKILALTPNGEGVKVVFDGTGAGQFENDLLVLRRKGTLLSYGSAGGNVPPFTIARLGQKSIRLLRPRVFVYIETREELEHYAKLLFDVLESKKLDVKVHEVYPLKDVSRAHTDLEGRKTMGKLVLKI